MQYQIIILLWNFIFFILINTINTEKMHKKNRKLQNGQIINLKVIELILNLFQLKFILMELYQQLVKESSALKMMI